MSSSKKTNERAIAVKSKNRNDSAQSVCLFFRPLYVTGKQKNVIVMSALFLSARTSMNDVFELRAISRSKR